MVNFLTVVFCFVLISSCPVFARICLNRSGLFTPNGAYDLNRRVMLSSLPSNVTANDGFYMTSTGEVPNRVYGLGMCVAGSDTKSCSECIISASNGVLENCTNQIEAVDWRINMTTCLLRYSNRSFYGSLDTELLRSFYNTVHFHANTTDFDITWEALMIGVLDEASSSYFGARSQRLASSILSIYGFMQCSRDISLGNCTECLQQNMVEYRSCCRGTQSGIISRPSCFTRWDNFPFLERLFDNNSPREKG